MPDALETGELLIKKDCTHYFSRRKTLRNSLRPEVSYEILQTTSEPGKNRNQIIFIKSMQRFKFS